MLDLIRDFAVDSGIEFALHTGSAPQTRRRAEIRRFREDPSCRLFLSSESGGVGLNLQVADTVINMGQPWNAARLEQRVARTWRKHQTRAVSVINLVSENTIEHRMLGLLDQKRVLASTGQPEPEDNEAAAAFLLQREESAGALPLDAIRLLSGEVPEASVVAAVRALLDAVSRRAALPGKTTAPARPRDERAMQKG